MTESVAARSLTGLVTFSIGALTLWAFDGNRTGITWSRHIKWWLLSAIAISVVILWASLASGTSLAGLVDGFVLKSLAFSQEVYSPAALDSRSVTWAFLSTALAVAYFAQHTFGSGRASFNMFVEAFKTLFGIGVIVFASVPGTLLWFGTPLLWLLVVSLPDAPKDVQATLPRLFLAFLAVLQSLHAFPLAGSQLGYSTFLLIPAGLICLHDVVRVRLGLGNERKRIPSFSLVLSGLMLFGVVAAYTFWAGLGYRDYHSCPVNDSVDGRQPVPAWLRAVFSLPRFERLRDDWFGGGRQWFMLLRPHRVLPRLINFLPDYVNSDAA